MMKLSMRLETILKMVPKSIVADVGSDHGKLMIALYERGIIKHGYAIENKIGPFKRLVKALSEIGIEENIIPLFSDGLNDLPKCVNTIVIAGMGGNSIINILVNNLNKLNHVSTIIIDAHSCVPQIRKFISGLGYIISEEKIVKENNIFYEIIRFCKSDIAFYSENDIEFGPILRNEKTVAFKEKYQQRIKEIDSLLTSNKNLPISRIKSLQKEKEKISKVI